MSNDLIHVTKNLHNLAAAQSWSGSLDYEWHGDSCKPQARVFTSWTPSFHVIAPGMIGCSAIFCSVMTSWMALPKR